MLIPAQHLIHIRNYRRKPQRDTAIVTVTLNQQPPFTMNTILLPTDFSTNANCALTYATALAKEHNAKLILLYAYDIPLMAPTGIFSTRAHAMEDTETTLREKVRARMAALVKEHGLEKHPHVCLMRQGSVVTTIAEEANAQHCDLIVMGTLGESSTANVLLGSVTNGVIRATKTPVLAIPYKTRYRSISRIVYATSLSCPELETFENITALAKRSNASVDFLYVDNNSGGEEQYQHALARFIVENDYKKLALTSVQTSDPATGINDFAEERAASIVALTSHSDSFFKHLFHRSVAKALSLHSHVPVLVYSA